MKNCSGPLVKILVLILTLSGCGAMQAVKDTTLDVGKAILFTQVKNLKLDLVAREELNPDDKGSPLSVLVRVYQLKDVKSFSAATYSQILSDDKAILGADLLARKELVLSPGATISLDEPMHKEANQIAVVALYRMQPKDSVWWLLLKKQNLDNDKPAKLEFSASTIRLVSVPHPD